ncbi:6-phosphogluconate dehydrogenase, decarboxylating 3 [Tanacetum coccineum]
MLRLCAAIVVPLSSHYDAGKHIKLCKIERRGDGGGYVQRLQAEEQVGDVIQACRRADDAIVFSRKIGTGPENKIKKQIREEEKRKKKTTTTVLYRCGLTRSDEAKEKLKKLDADEVYTKSQFDVKNVSSLLASNFVKMVHNGIEYRDVQLILKAYDVLKYVGKLSNEELQELFFEWNKGELQVLRSNLRYICH